jgi:hypothetical protein
MRQPVCCGSSVAPASPGGKCFATEKYTSFTTTIRDGMTALSDVLEGGALDSEVSPVRDATQFAL